MKNDYKDWVKQSFPWVLASTAILGLAIMLGGYWAYGVLGWGGYWGWDPVENSSLVPWIIGVAAVHTLLIQLKTQSPGSAGRYVKTNLILCIMTYVLVLYSTFLTRSGILGDASVHSFVDPGMTVYLLLVLFIGTFTILGFGAIAYRWKYLEKTFQGEDNVLSRELALFTGAVALIASAIIIIAGTSAPIFGRSVELNFYNELNLPIAIIMGLLNGLSLMLKWKHTQGKNLWEQSRNSLIATTVLSLLVIIFGGITELMAIIFTFSSVFTLVVNAEIAYRVFKIKKQNLGAYVAHAGIAFFMLGVISTGGFTSEQQAVLVQNQPQNVLGYDLTFKGYNTFDDGRKYAFDIEVSEEGNASIVAPVMFVAEFNNSLMREPDIWSRMTKDFYISPISYNENKNHDHGSNASTHITINKSETYDFNGSKITFSGFNFPQDAMSAMQAGNEFFIGAELVVTGQGKSFNVEPRMISKSGQKSFDPVEINDLNLRIRMTDLDASGTIKLALSELNAPEPDESEATVPMPSLTIDASEKPFIGLVWLGTLVVTLGFVVSVVRRTKEAKV
jgi:cytochrome c-type biogenesis protein CcmF